jgi:gliding motility-associated transport system permease protein
VRAFAALLAKEEAALFSSPVAYVVLTVFLVLMGYTFTVTLFVNQLASLVHLFFQMYVLFLLSIPILTMRLLAEERRLRTLELLLTSPVTEAQVVLAKYLASMTLVALMVALSGSYAVVLGLFSDPNWAPIYGGYLGLLLLGSALVSLGLLASSLTANQLVAALLSLGLFLLFWVIDDFGWVLPVPFDTLFVNLSLSVHFVPFAIGSLYLSDAGFFLSLTLLGLFLSVRALGRR